MVKRISLRSMLLSLGLALFVAGWTGCKASPEKSVLSGTPSAKTAPTQPGAATPPEGMGQTAPSAQTSQTAPQTPPKLSGAPVSPLQAGPLLSPEKIPEVVARVNGKEIKKGELMEGAQMVQMRMAQVGHPITPTADLYRQVLNQLISLDLLQEDAKAQGITVSDDEVQRALAIRKRAFPSEQVYKQALAQAGITEDRLRQQARENLVYLKYLQTRLAPKAAVSDQAMHAFYDQHKGEMQVPERLHLRHIFIKADAKAPAAERDKAKQKAQDALKRLQGGEDFAKLAQEISDDGSKSRGGDIGFITHEQTAPAFEAAAFALKKPNDLSPVVESNRGFHIIQLLERQGASTLPYDQVKDRIAAVIRQQEVQKVSQARANELRAKSKVQVYL
jgi:parvulin-like peptidyl-prolyl isomerase